MRVQSKRWFRRNRRKSPKLVKVLQCINREYPSFAHRIEIDFWTSPVGREVKGWYNCYVIVSSLPSGRVIFHTMKDGK